MEQEVTGPVPEYEMLQALHTSVTLLGPIFEAAEGIKADLERRGWSPAVAESVAHQWMLNILDRIWKS